MSKSTQKSTQQLLIELKQSISTNHSNIQLLFNRIQELEKLIHSDNCRNEKPCEAIHNSYEIVKCSLSAFKKELGNSVLSYIIVNDTRKDINWEQLIIDLDYKGKVGKAPPRKELIEMFIEYNNTNNYTICYIKNDKQFIYENIYINPSLVKSGRTKKLSSPITTKSKKTYTEPEPQQEFKPEPELKPEPKPELKPKPEPEPEPEPEPKPKPELKSEPEPELEPKLQPESEPELKLKQSLNDINDNYNYKYIDLTKEEISKKLFTYRIHDIYMDNVSQIELIKHTIKKDIINIKEACRVIFPLVSDHRLTAIYFFEKVLDYCVDNKINILIQIYDNTELMRKIKPLNIYQYNHHILQESNSESGYETEDSNYVSDRE